jgi:UDP-glucose 4-epimerase
VPHQADDTGAFYVKDCAAAIQLVQMADKLSHRIYNISGAGPMTYGEFVAVVKRAVPGAQIDLPAGRGPRYRPNAYLDITRLTQDLGYQPQYSIERAVEEYMDWLRKYPE